MVSPGLAAFETDVSSIVIVRLLPYISLLFPSLLPHQLTNHATIRVRPPHQHDTSLTQAHSPLSSPPHPPVSQPSQKTQRHTKQTPPPTRLQRSRRRYSYSDRPTASWHTNPWPHTTTHACPLGLERRHPNLVGDGWNSRWGSPQAVEVPTGVTDRADEHPYERGVVNAVGVLFHT